jgi:hypothetical protein
MNTLPILSAALLGFAQASTSLAQTAPAHEFLPPLPAGKEWKLIWHDEFDGTKLDETKWNRLGDHVRKGCWWLKEDAFLSGKGTLLLRTKKDGDRFTCGALNTKEVWHTKAGGVSQVPEYLKLTEEIGTWGGDIKKAELPDFCEVDYVRAYILSPEACSP